MPAFAATPLANRPHYGAGLAADPFVGARIRMSVAPPVFLPAQPFPQGARATHLGQLSCVAVLVRAVVLRTLSFLFA